MRICITTVFLLVFFIALSCTFEIDNRNLPECLVTVTNEGLFLMLVFLEDDEAVYVESKYVQVDQSETWYLDIPDSHGCNFLDMWCGSVKATYIDSSLTDGGWSEERYCIPKGNKKSITLKDCPGWF